MAFTTSNPVAVGSDTEKSHYDAVFDNTLLLKTAIDDGGNLAPPAATTLTLASDACTPTQNVHKVDTQAAAAADDLVTLTIAGNIRAGHLLILYAANVAHVVTVKETGNISLLGGNCVLDTADRFLTLLLVGTTWREIARSSASPAATPLTPTMQNSNGATKTAILAVTIPANALAATGYKIEADFWALCRNFKGTAGTVTYECAYGSATVAAPAVTVNSFTDISLIPFIFKAMRIGSDLCVRWGGGFGVDDYEQWSISPATAVRTLTIAAPDFTTDQTLEIRVTLSANDVTFYVNGQAANVTLVAKG